MISEFGGYKSTICNEVFVYLILISSTSPNCYNKYEVQKLDEYETQTQENVY